MTDKKNVKEEPKVYKSIYKKNHKHILSDDEKEMLRGDDYTSHYKNTCDTNIDGA